VASWRGSEQITAQAGSTIAKRHGAQRTDVQGEFVRDTNGRLIRGRLDRVVVMEKRTGWGAEYPDELRNGEWEYSDFNAMSASDPKRTLCPLGQYRRPKCLS